MHLADIILWSRTVANKHKEAANAQYVSLPSPTNCSRQLTQAALWILRKVYKPGVYYMRASVLLSELVPHGGQQRELFGYSEEDTRASTLMSTMDAINKKYARGAIKLASEGIETGWAMRRAFKSPNYTTIWSDFPKVR